MKKHIWNTLISHHCNALHNSNNFFPSSNPLPSFKGGVWIAKVDLQSSLTFVATTSPLTSPLFSMGLYPLSWYPYIVTTSVWLVALDEFVLALLISWCCHIFSLIGDWQVWVPAGQPCTGSSLQPRLALFLVELNSMEVSTLFGLKDKSKSKTCPGILLYNLTLPQIRLLFTADLTSKTIIWSKVLNSLTELNLCFVLKL